MEGICRLRTGGPIWRHLSPALTIILVIVLTNPIRSAAAGAAWPDEKRLRGQVVHFEYIEPPVLPSLSGVVKTLFWRSERVRGRPQPGYAHYLWEKKQWFSTAQEIADYLRANSPLDATITGASTVAPLIAILSGRRIAANEVDTNSNRFMAGMITEEEFWRRVCNTKLAFVIGADNSYFSLESVARQKVMQQCFSMDRAFRDHDAALKIVLYRRLQDLSGQPHAALGDSVTYSQGSCCGIMSRIWTRQ